MIAWFVRNPVAANMLMCAIIGLGLLTLYDLRKETFPNPPPSRITISVFYESGSARQAEENIALKIEEALENVNGIQEVSSTSTRRGTTTTIRKTVDTELTKLLDDVKAEIDAIATLPGKAERPIVREQKWEETAIRLQVFGDAELHTLTALAESLRDDLLAQTGIARVHLHGIRTPEIAIEADEASLHAHNLELADLAQAVLNESTTDVSGVLRDPNLTMQLTADAPRYHAEQFGAIVLRDHGNGSRLRLDDVATISDGYANSPQQWLRFQGKPSIGLRVAIDQQADVLEVVEQTHAVVQRWRDSGRLPHNVELVSWDDRSLSIEARLSMLVLNGLLGILLVVLLLSVFLQPTVAFWVAMGLPICFAGALFAMGEPFFALSLNEVSTFGFIVAMGIIVDDAIVVGESIYTHRSINPVESATVAGVHRVAMPTLIGGATTIIAFAAMAAVEGEFGFVFGQFSLVVAACLAFSMIESKLILPAHLRRVQQTSGTGMTHRLRLAANAQLERFREQLFLPLLRHAIQHRYSALMLLLGTWTLAVGLVSLGHVRTVFFPSIPVTVVHAEVEIVPDGSYGHTERALARLETAAHRAAASLSKEAQAPVLEHLLVRMTGDLEGYASVALHPENTVAVRDFAETWRREIGLPEGVASLDLEFEELVPEALRIELKGVDYGQVQAAGRALLAQLSPLPELRDLRHNLNPGAAEIHLQPTDQGRALGLTTQDLAQQLQQAFFGFETQRIQRGRDEVKVRVRYPEEARASTTDLWDMRVRTPAGTTVPLSTVAVATTTYPVVERTRINNHSAVWISAEVDKTVSSPDAVVSQIESTLIAPLRRAYPQVRVDFRGEAEEAAIIRASMTQIAGIALVCVYALLAIVLKSYSAPLLIMAVIPFGVGGAIVGHWLHDLSFSLLSLFGVLALGGVIINDSLLLVSRYRARLVSDSPIDAILGAASERLRAIILTSLTTYIGLVPLIANTSVHGAYLKPAAASLAYGVLLGTLITLILIPVLVMIAEDLQHLGRRVGGLNTLRRA
ncbi:MAG: efflux RND transporter permease subunit [Pseudomonadota bacterium]